MVSADFAPIEHFDVIVVGGGHAGCEAAITAARLGCSTALFSLNLDRIAWQPCNPAVGGPAKSQLVHEVDALGGVIGRLADATALQKRVLNASRGPAVWALRAQTDKRQYSRQMLQLLQHTPNLALREAMVTGLVVEGDAVDPGRADLLRQHLQRWGRNPDRRHLPGRTDLGGPSVDVRRPGR